MDHPMQHHRTLHGDFFIVGAEKTEEINFMVDMDFAFTLCLVGGVACSRSLAARDEFAAAGGRTEHGAAKTAGYSLDAVFRQMSAAVYPGLCGRDRYGAVKYNSHTPGRGTRFRTLGRCVQHCTQIP